ncbi:hypothetical protein COEREDRAFT_6917 [Coemansia reversa NRRL 1564]|uniref:Uncharacterized protein n=1 Tax=Coemansia reversa (strain ATCC 12441 / NRRL 1564) TaxID=763665 RepID=A0A2G5BGQ6_COERN|nr:hypothetical protein COEREDRAFT_6917 [Coemansia reversa NRRL 1564]|eukprot:PIA18183.1 hypothetical protein COEREDRAFT_6917 [Coemansia reversa NRRL 1564]
MKVLSVFLFLSSALAQHNSNSGNSNLRLAEAVDTPAVSIDSLQASADAAGDFIETTAATEDVVQSNESENSYTPLFDFDLEPYNVALDIVADALEKLADTMEPLDVPLPMVGAGYYLEVQVKSPKNQNGSPPIDQINSVSIEGGQASPVTEIDIILPGNSDVHQTILIPVDSQETLSPELPPGYLESFGYVSDPVSVPDSEPDDGSLSGSEVIPTDAVEPVYNSYLSPPFLAETEPANAPLTSTFPEVSGSDLLQTISPEAPTAMNTASGLESFKEIETQQEEVSTAPSGFFSGSNVSDAIELSQEETVDPSDVASDFSSITEPPSEDEIEYVTSGSYGLSVSPEEESLTLGSASSSVAVEIVASNSVGFSISQTPAISSSAPGALSLDSTSAVAEQSQLEPENVGSETEGLTSDEVASEEQEEGNADSKTAWNVEDVSNESETLDSVDNGSTPLEFASASIDSDVTMASAPLPFPPFGGPQSQQPPVSDLNNAIDTQSNPTDIPNVESGNIIDTIEVVDALDDNALESSIDAVLHSVIQDYKTVSTPKAAVGFALIHPRSMSTQPE